MVLGKVVLFVLSTRGQKYDPSLRWQMTSYSEHQHGTDLCPPVLSKYHLSGLYS